MSRTELTFSREYDLPPSIVWDALVDPDLVSGWLAVADIDPSEGGRYDLSWRSGGRGETKGVIETLVEDQLLEIETDNVGFFLFRLERRAGGTRGSSTFLTIIVDTDTHPRFLPIVEAYWRSNLDQLEGLLRGYPVDWDHWDRDRLPVWEEYLRTTEMRD